MNPQQRLSKTGYLYIACVITAGLAVTAYSGLLLAVHPVSNQWLILAALTLLTGSFSVKIPSIAARILGGRLRKTFEATTAYTARLAERRTSQ